MRYVGSKNRFAKEIVPIIQSYITEETKGYLEPFVGGGNVIDKIKCNNKIGCDIHEERIELLKYAQINYNKLPETISKEEYEQVKANKDKYPKWYVGLVGFCSGYNGKYFGGYANNVVTKIGTIRNYTDEAIRNLKKQAPNLKNINFYNCDFRDLPKDKIKGYVIYCDIPYKGTTKYKADKFPYEEFYQWCKDMAKDNIVLISEYNMPKVFRVIWEKEVKTSLNCNRKAEDESNKRVERLFIYDAESGYIEE